MRLRALVDLPKEADHPLHQRPAKVFPSAEYRHRQYSELTDQRIGECLEALDTDVVIGTRPGLNVHVARQAPQRVLRVGLHGAELREDATVRLRLRGSDTVRDLSPRIDGDGRGFSFTTGPEDLTGGAAGPGRIWDAFVRPAADAPPIRIGRLLDDVADRKHVFVYPALTAGGLSSRPYYTVDNDLAIEVAPAESPICPK